MANRLERGGPRLVIPPLSTAGSDGALRGLERNSVGVIDGRQSRPENDGLSRLSQCHAQEPWVCCAPFE